MSNTAVRRPSAGRRASRWRSAVAVAAPILLAAGCDGAPGTAPDLAARTGRDLPPDQIAQLVAEHLVPSDFDEPADERLVMELRGELLFANLALGRTLRGGGLTTYVPREALVASGGTDLLLAGARRIVECGAHVGVHSWAFGPVSGNELPRDDPQHSFYLDYYRDLGIPEAFYWFTLEAAAPDSIHWMTEDEMARYEVYTHFRGPCGAVSSWSGQPAASARSHLR